MRQTATGLAIAGFAIGLIAVFVPLVGIYVSGVALALCAVAAYLGEKVLTIATVAITAAKTFFLSLYFHTLAAEHPVTTYAVVIVALAVPLLAMAAGNSSRAAPTSQTNTTGMPGR